MKHAVTAIFIALGAATAAQAGVPTMTLPDLTFPTPPETPTQDCNTLLTHCR